MNVRKLTGLALAALIAAVVVACGPTWSGGSSLTPTIRGPLVTLNWTAATPGDGKTVTDYRIHVDGVEVATIAAPATTCVLTGLAPSTTHVVKVTAYDNEGYWSGSWEDEYEEMGRVQASVVTTAAMSRSGATRTCVASTDSDSDGLPNAVENGGGTYVSAAVTGTNSNDADSDDDGIKDGDEVLGSAAGLDLFGMGTRPGKRDILLEFDWFDDNLDSGTCGPHSHRPSAAAITTLANSFAAASGTNPDGSTGINLIADRGQGGLFTGGTVVADADGVIAGGVDGADYLGYKAANFSPLREGYFHYVLNPHRYNTTSGSSGQAEIQGDDLIVSLQCYLSDSNVSNTIMHELGHNLNLRHGGFENTNYKPNYNSIMNYRFQFPGVDTNCDGTGNGVLDYSRGTNASLNENALIETNGICNGVDKDWNANAIIDAAAVAAHINIDYDSVLTVLNDWNDWANLNLAAVNDGDGAPLEPTEIVTEASVEELLGEG
jgi:hypothetical protein